MTHLRDYPVLPPLLLAAIVAALPPLGCAGDSEGGALPVGPGSGGAAAGGGGGEAGGAGGLGGGPASPICDGTERPRLRLYIPANLGRVTRYSTAQVENGYSQFLVDGRCQYWMQNRDPGVRATELEIRTGHLDTATALALDGSFPLGALAGSLADCTPDGTFDQEPRVIADAAGGALCSGRGPKFDAAWDAVDSRAAQLWIDAAAVQGPVRISVGPATSNGTIYPWPLTVPLSELLLPEGKALARGVTTRFDAPADTAALRTLRAMYLADRSATPGYFFDGMKVSDAGATYYVYMRDSTPYEAANGLLPFTPPGGQ